MNRYTMIAILTVVLVGCLKTRAELEAEESGKTQERQTIAQQKVPSGAAQVVKEKAPPSAYRFEEIDEQMRALNGRIDSVENSVQQIHTAKQNEKEFGTKEKQATEQKFLAYEDALKKMEAQIIALNEEVTRLKTPPPEPPAAASAKGGKANYDLGEEHFTQKKWKEAIVNFQKYRDQNPKGKFYSDATYKIGVCFQEIGMKDEARSFLEEVTSKYPNTKEAKKAQVRLKTLK